MNRTRTLTRQLALVVESLAGGATISAASRAAGIHRTTVYAWLKSQPAFAAAVAAAKQEYVETLRDDLKDLESIALSILRALLEQPNTPPSVRLRTALAVLQRPQFPKPGWSLPEPTGSEQQEKFRQDFALLEAGYNRMRMEEALDRLQYPARPAPLQFGQASAPLRNT